jgi:hypothetical protein
MRGGVRDEKQGGGVCCAVRMDGWGIVDAPYHGVFDRKMRCCMCSTYFRVSRGILQPQIY